MSIGNRLTKVSDVVPMLAFLPTEGRAGSLARPSESTVGWRTKRYACPFEIY